MGTLRATVRLSSSDVLSTNLDLNTATDITADSGAIQRVKVAATAVSNDAQTVHKADEKVDRSYLYVKNLDPIRENYLIVYEIANDTKIAKLAGGEFCFVPVDPSATLKVYATKADQIMEFGSFGLDSSAVRYS